MAEPSYETQPVSVNEAISAINNGWFCQQMMMLSNTHETNQQLAVRIWDLKDQGGFRAPDRTKDAEELMRMAASNATRVTFECMRCNRPDWHDVLISIIHEEVERERKKVNGFGSQRGFNAFVFPMLCKTILARTVVEMWAIPTIKRRLRTYVKRCVEARFAPGGAGFMEAQQHYKELACAGCREGQANQEAHMGVGGCIYIPPPPKLIRQTAFPCEMMMETTDYKLNSSSIHSILCEAYKRHPTICDDQKREIKHFVTNFSTTEKKLYGNWNEYDMTNDKDYNGIYGYLLDKIDGHFKFGDDIS